MREKMLTAIINQSDRQGYKTYVIENGVSLEDFDALDKYDLAEETVEGKKYAQIFYKKIFYAIKDYYEKHEITPDYNTLCIQFSDPEHKDLLKFFTKMHTSWVPEEKNDKQVKLLVEAFKADRLLKRHVKTFNDSITDGLSVIDKTDYDEVLGLSQLVIQNQITMYESQSVPEEKTPEETTEYLLEAFRDSRLNRDKDCYSIGLDGLEDLDGWEKDDYVVIAGESGTGKTQLLCKFAAEQLKQGRRVLFYEGEMQTIKIENRVCSAITGIHQTALKHGNESVEEQYIDYLNNQRVNFNFKIITSDDFGKIPTMSDIAKEAIKFNPDIIFIDQISLLADENRSKVYWEKYSNISQQIKSYQTRFGIPFIVANQLNRQDGDGMSRTAGSIRIHQDASKYITLTKKEPPYIQFKIDKSRNGETGKEIVYQVDLGRCSFKCEGIPEADEITLQEDTIFI